MYDMKNLSKMKSLETNAPEAMKAFVAFDRAALAEGAIPRKYKELMALAVARRSPKLFSSLRRCARGEPSPTAHMP
jgi:alkylhydroperoxidase/carboxymuconolactone decarboxylase family protein YurZ